MAKYHANFLSNPAIGTIVDKPISIMKNLIYSLSLLLLISIFSCSKKYDGCCTYTIHYKIGNPDKVVNDCFTQESKAVADGKKGAYHQAQEEYGNSLGQPYEASVTGPGCNY